MIKSDSAPSRLGERFLAYTNSDLQDLAMDSTAPYAASGIAVRDQSPFEVLARANSYGYANPILVDVGIWTSQVATYRSPTILHQPGALLPRMSLDSWASPLLAAGAAAVATPSKFVRVGEWRSLRAVVEAGEETSLPGVVTLVATDAAMLDPPYRQRFIRALNFTRRPVALIFAAKSRPLGGHGRPAGLRKVISEVSGCILLAVEPIAAADAVSFGAGAVAIGMTGRLRQPRRPGDLGAGPNALNFTPGLFLRELWEHRSPDTYGDWFANSPSPTCDVCGGRALDCFGRDPSDKEIVLRHNVHAWLGVHADLHGLNLTARRLMMTAERADALAAHLQLRPAVGHVEADSVLRQLVELDDPYGRRTTSQGALR
jgi:hypothetical protein